jgi:hypothetical protein
MPSLWRARARGAGAIAAATALLLLWLLDIAHHGLPRRVDQAGFAAALALGSLWLVDLVRRLWRGELLGRAAGRFLLLAVALALLAEAVGLGHEIGGRYFGDEGWFLAEAKRINAERALRPWFVYPHFLFYWDAFALWLADLCGPVVPALARRIWGVEDALGATALVTRGASALLAALSTVPTFLAARRLARLPGADGETAGAAGARAGLAAALLLGLSPTLVEVGHLNLADVPTALWSACVAYGVVLLMERETVRRYVLTGAAAGLAAASKYPAGVVAVAIAAAWLRGVVGRRRLGAGLLWAALAAIAAFVLAMPSILRWPEVAFVGGEGHPDVFFGVRLYGKAHWHGVVRESNALYYLRELAHAFGWPALVLGGAGVLTLPRELRRRLLWLLAFPLAHLALLLAMAIAVRRNLMPTLPFLALPLGCGLAGLFAWCAERWRRPIAVAVVASALLLPTAATAVLLVRHSRPTTRDAAAAWMRSHLPPGSFLVQEQYTPLVGPEEIFPARRPRFAARLEPQVLRDPQHDYLLLSSEAYGRFFDTGNLENLASDETARRYRDIFESTPLVREWTPGRFQDGPTLRLYRLDPAAPEPAGPGRLDATQAFVSSPGMKASGAEIRFEHEGEWALFKIRLDAGAYRVRTDGSTTGRLRVRVREDESESVTAFASGEARFSIGQPRKVFLYLELAPGSRLDGVVIEAASAL